ncbi:MAG: HEAT repeat domain-containing protein [Spirochaetaceae bacterium]
MALRIPTLILASLACVSLSAVWPQDQTDGSEDTGADWIRLESARSGRTHAEQTEVHVIHARAASADRAMQMQALERVRTLVEENDPVSRFPEITEIVSLLVLEPYRVARYGGDASGTSGGNGTPEVRIEALELLGRIGGQEAYDVVVESLRVERDPAVRAAALRVLPRLDVRPGDELPDILARSLRQSSRDPASLRAALETVRELHGRYGFMDTPELFTAVIDVAQGPHGAGLRRDAFSVVELLRE